jgi:hypothetical protein
MMRMAFIVLHLVIATLQARTKALGPTIDNAVKEKSSFEGAMTAKSKVAINCGRNEF